MRDIEKAYLAEQEYIKNDSGTKIDLLDLLKPFGYTMLREYFNDKFYYLVKKYNIQFSYCTIEEQKNNFLLNKDSKIGVFSANEDATWAWVGNPDYFDYDKAKELNVGAYDLGHHGGAIITSNNDINITINLPIELFNILPFSFIEKFNDLLDERGYDTHIDNNDILLEDGSKIAGTVGLGNEKYCNFGISLSLSDHSFLIEQLCKKKSGKAPSYITGITKEEIEQEVKKWLQLI